MVLHKAVFLWCLVLSIWMKMVDLCLRQTFRSLGSTTELRGKLTNLCQVLLFPCFLVYYCNDCAYAVCHLLPCACCKLWSRAALSITCPQVMFCLLLARLTGWPWLYEMLLECWFLFYFCSHLLPCLSLPSLQLCLRLACLPSVPGDLIP